MLLEFWKLKTDIYFCSPKRYQLKRWCSSVGRAIDWKSMCRRFDSVHHHRMHYALTVNVEAFLFSQTCGQSSLMHLNNQKAGNAPAFWLFPILISLISAQTGIAPRCHLSWTLLTDICLWEGCEYRLPVAVCCLNHTLSMRWGCWSVLFWQTPNFSHRR